MRWIFGMVFAVAGCADVAGVDTSVDASTDSGYRTCEDNPTQPGCPEAPPPTCASLGCPGQPSGSPDVWTPCGSTLCYCPVNGAGVSCTR